MATANTRIEWDFEGVSGNEPSTGGIPTSENNALPNPVSNMYELRYSSALSTEQAKSGTQSLKITGGFDQIAVKNDTNNHHLGDIDHGCWYGSYYLTAFDDNRMLMQLDEKVNNTGNDPSGGTLPYDGNSGIKLLTAENGTDGLAVSLSGIDTKDPTVAANHTAGTGADIITPRWWYTLPLNQWVDIQVFYSRDGSQLPDGKTLILYVDGQEIASTTEYIAQAGPEAFHHYSIGHDLSSGLSGPYYIDEFGVEDTPANGAERFGYNHNWSSDECRIAYQSSDPFSNSDKSWNVVSAAGTIADLTNIGGTSSGISYELVVDSGTGSIQTNSFYYEELLYTANTWVETNGPGKLIGGAVVNNSANVATFSAITDGSFSIALDGGGSVDVTGINFTGDQSLRQVADTIGAAITGASCLYRNGGLVILSDTKSAASAVSFLGTAASGTDISSLMQMRSGQATQTTGKNGINTTNIWDITGDGVCRHIFGNLDNATDYRIEVYFKHRNSGSTDCDFSVDGFTTTYTPAYGRYNDEATLVIEPVSPTAGEITLSQRDGTAASGGIQALRIVPLVSAATGPSLTSPTGTATGKTTASGTVTTDTSTGTLYYLISQNASESVANVKAGSSQAVTGTGAQNVSSSGLTQGTNYYYHYVHNDGVDDSSVATSPQFTTQADDTTPDQFDLGADVTGAEPSTTTTRSFTSAGIDEDITWTATGAAEVSLSEFTGYGPSVVAGNATTIYCRLQASSSYATLVTGGVTANGVSDSFNITTRAEVAPTLASTLALSGVTGQERSWSLFTAGGDPATGWATVGGPNQANYTVTSEGIFSVIAAPLVDGQEQVQVQASNGAGPSNTQTITITFTEGGTIQATPSIGIGIGI